MQHTLHPAAATVAPALAPARRSARKRFAALGVATLAALGLTLGAAAPALAHDELTGYTFSTNADGAATGIVLSFNNEILTVGTEIHVTGPDQRDVTEGEPQVSGRDVTQAVTAPLPAGEDYQVTWRVVSSDGHPIQGMYSFAVAANGAAEVTAVGGTDPRFSNEDAANETGGDAAELHEHDHGDDAAHSDHSAPAERADSAFPVGGWIALAAIVIVGAGSVAFFAARGRKKSAGAVSTDSNDGNTPSTHTEDHSGNGAAN